jgi:superfamily I DNA/RNA helicase
VGGQEFFKRREIKDAIAYLTMCVNPGNDQALLRLLTSPPRGLGDKAVEVLKSLRAGLHKPMSMLLGDEEFLHRMTPQARKSASALAETFAKWRQEFSSPGDLAPRLELFLRETGYIDGLQKIYKDAGDVVKRRDNIDEFISAAAEFQSRQVDKPAKLEDFLASFALLEDNTSDEDKADNDAVILSTVHASKGLEFPNVFLIGMENGCFPHERSKVEGTVDEELRLFYVAITRARKRLTISRSRSRMNRGRREVRRQSDFLRLLPPDLVQEGGADDFIRPPSQEELLKQLAGIMDMLK